jgi:hypothetical protein
MGNITFTKEQAMQMIMQAFCKGETWGTTYSTWWEPTEEEKANRAAKDCEEVYQSALRAMLGDDTKTIQQKYPQLSAEQEQPFDSEAFLRGILTNAIYKVDRKEFPDVAFFGLDADGNCLFHYDDKKNLIWLHYPKIWRILESKNNWSYEQTQRFIKGMVENHFKSKEVAPRRFFRPAPTRVEDHFKSKEVAPGQVGDVLYVRVEDHFKSKGAMSNDGTSPDEL